jgi:LEA14-like dessication related protein
MRQALALALWLAVSCSALCGGCAALVPKLEAPQLQLVGVTLEGGDAQQQQIRLALHVVNPNPRVIEVRAIECALEIARDGGDRLRSERERSSQ